MYGNRQRSGCSSRGPERVGEADRGGGWRQSKTPVPVRSEEGGYPDYDRFFTTTSESYYAAAVNRDWRHLPLVRANEASKGFRYDGGARHLPSPNQPQEQEETGVVVEVRFRVLLGRTPIYSLVSTEPYEDGVFYFEAIDEFKVPGDYTLELTARVGSLVVPSDAVQALAEALPEGCLLPRQR